jgi:hypothetical protein
MYLVRILKEARKVPQTDGILLLWLWLAYSLRWYSIHEALEELHHAACMHRMPLARQRAVYSSLNLCITLHIVTMDGMACAGGAQQYDRQPFLCCQQQQGKKQI